MSQESAPSATYSTETAPTAAPVVRMEKSCAFSHGQKCPGSKVVRATGRRSGPCECQHVERIKSVLDKIRLRLRRRRRLLHIQRSVRYGRWPTIAATAAAALNSYKGWLHRKTARPTFPVASPSLPPVPFSPFRGLFTRGVNPGSPRGDPGEVAPIG